MNISLNGLTYYKIIAFLTWWYLLASGVTSFFLQYYDLWFSGFDGFNNIIIPLIIILLLSKTYINRVPDIANNASLFLVILFFLIIFISITYRIDYLLTVEFQSVKRYLYWILFMILSWVVGFGIMSSKHIYKRVFNNKINIIFFFIPLWALVTVPYSEITTTQRIGSLDGGSIFIIAYIFIIAAVVVLSYALHSNIIIFLALLIITEILLFIISLRGLIIVFNISLFIILIFYVISKKNNYRVELNKKDYKAFKKICVISIIVLVIIICFLFVYDVDFLEWFVNLMHRANIFSYDPTQDGSFIQRRIQLQKALDVIEDNVFLGRYAYEIEYRTIYVHSFLSTWPSHGTISFILIIAIMFLSIRKLYFLRNSLYPEHIAIKWLFLIFLFTILFFRPMHIKQFWFFLGCIMAIKD